MDVKLQDLNQHRQIAQLIAALDKTNFWVLLVRTIHSLVDFDNWVVLRFSDNEKPLVYIENPTKSGLIL